MDASKRLAAIRSRLGSLRLLTLPLVLALALGGCSIASRSEAPVAQGTIDGRAMAGPVCPVARIPPDPGCADRPVPGATVIIRDASGAEVGRATTDPNGRFSIQLPPGTYEVAGDRQAGLLGGPSSVTTTVEAGQHVEVTLSYDTGIR
jgi:hypothetical protein